MRFLPAHWLLFLLAAPLGAQSGSAPDSSARAMTAVPRPANDSIFRRARRLVGEGNGVAGRALVDSLLRIADQTTPAYGDALYWHGALASTAAEAERDYRRVIVEYPLAYYAEDALLAIAELEQARGDRAAALQHLQRYVREHRSSPGRAVAALGAARLAFEQRDTTTGCAMIAAARSSAAPDDVELRNQLDYHGSRCNGVVAQAATPAAAPLESAPAPRAEVRSVPPAVTSPPPSPRSATHASSIPSSAPAAATAPPRTATTHAPSGMRYTIQVAAYETKVDADRLVQRLASRGVKARVSGSSRPFRVRLDFYKTQKEAVAEVAALKRRGIIGFVTEEIPPERR